MKYYNKIILLISLTFELLHAIFIQDLYFFIYFSFDMKEHTHIEIIDIIEEKNDKKIKVRERFAFVAPLELS